jgi:hypothetical protein
VPETAAATVAEAATSVSIAAESNAPLEPPANAPEPETSAAVTSTIAAPAFAAAKALAEPPEVDSVDLYFLTACGLAAMGL